MKRRDFISTFGTGATAAVVTGLTGYSAGHAETSSEAKKTKDSTAAGSTGGAIQKFSTIGSTDLKMSDISMGCGGLDNPYVVDHAIAQGINYFDTAPDYGNGNSEKSLGKVMKDPAKREKCIITTKICEMGRYGLHLDYDAKAAEITAAVEGSLTRLQTDYIDFVFVHAIGERENDRSRLTNPEMLTAIAKLKEQGKVRHFGTSSHGPNQFADHLLFAIETGHYELLMPAFNFMQHPRLTEVLKKAKEKGVGIVAMKTLAGARDEDLSKYKTEETSFAEAAFKWVFTHPEVNGLVVTMKNTADIDAYTRASGKRFSAADQEILDQYTAARWSDYCRTGCGDCLAHCPHGVAAPTLMRMDMYFTSYGEHLKALKEYRKLPEQMRPYACAECDGPCVQGCSFGLPVRERMLSTRRNLELA